MSKNNQVPKAPEYKKPQANTEISAKAMQHWDRNIRASSDGEQDNVINILDIIGYDWWTGEGATATNIQKALKRIGSNNDVVININSPGGDVFEGLAIYNLLREHAGKITVKILGVAASAASFIAMAADEIQIARAGFFMIHNAWTWSAGNRNDLLEVADFLAQVDETIADIYHIRTGIDVGEIADQMDAETWITGKKAVETGFADGYLPSDSVTTTDSNKSDNASNAAKRIDTIMAMQGIPRSERRALFNELKSGTQNATTTSTQNATVPQDVLKALQATAVGLKNLTKET